MTDLASLLERVRKASAMEKFMRELQAHGGFATRKALPLASREQDRARQACRAAGLVKWGTKPGVKNGRNGWRLMPRGAALLSALDTGSGR